MKMNPHQFKMNISRNQATIKAKWNEALSK